DAGRKLSAIVNRRPGCTGPAASRSALGAIVDEATATVLVDALAWVALVAAKQLADHGAGNSADCTADSGTREGTGGGTADGSTDQRAAGGRFFSGGAGGQRQRRQQGRDDEHDGFHWSLRDRFMVECSMLRDRFGSTSPLC